MKRRSGDRKTANPRDPRDSRGSVPQPTFNSKFFTSNLELFNKNFPTFEKPRAVGFFSLDVDRNYRNDCSQLRYLSLDSQSSIWTGKRTCSVNLNLRRGITSIVEKDDEDIQEKMLDDMLTWILQERRAKNPNIVNVKDPLLQLHSTEFVCFRGLLTLLNATPYEKEGWTLVASRHKNTVYMFQLKDCSDNRNFRQRRFKEVALWGFKFEQYLCVDKPGAHPNPDEELNTNAEFCCIIKTKIDTHSLLFGAEMDALMSDRSLTFEDLQHVNLEHFIELKTTRNIETQNQCYNFQRIKALKWWAQSFLVGIKTILCGYRNDNGIVSRLESLDLDQLRKNSSKFWKSNICFNFCTQFLAYVKDSIPMDESPSINYLLEYNPKLRVITCRKDTAGRCLRNLIPDWYLDLLQRPID